jgi:hypothetical protein
MFLQMIFGILKIAFAGYLSSEEALSAELQSFVFPPLRLSQIDLIEFRPVLACFYCQPVLFTPPRMKDKGGAKAGDAGSGIPSDAWIHDSVRSIEQKFIRQNL